jgi:hypothetical protein
MAFAEVHCSRCQHIGFARTGTLPRMLRCAACNFVEFFRRGRQTIRPSIVDDDDDDTDVPSHYGEAEAWARYEGVPTPQQLAATQPCPQRAKRKQRVRKVKLVPREPEAV